MTFNASHPKWWFKSQEIIPRWPSVTLMKYHDPPILLLCSLNMGKFRFGNDMKPVKFIREYSTQNPELNLYCGYFLCYTYGKHAKESHGQFFRVVPFQLFLFKWKNAVLKTNHGGQWARFWTHLTDLEHDLMGLKPQPLGIHFLSKAIEIATSDQGSVNCAAASRSF